MVLYPMLFTLGVLAMAMIAGAVFGGPPDEIEDEEDDDTDLYVPVPTAEDEADGQ